MLKKTMFSWLFVISLQYLTFCPLNSVYHFEAFLKQENDTMTALEVQIKTEIKRLENLQNTVANYKNAINYGNTFGVDNPIQYYLVMKNIVQQWNQVQSTIATYSNEDIEKYINDKRISQSVTLPTEDDLNAARVAIQRIQEVYNLKHEDIVNGMLVGNSELKFDANDCFEIGRLFYSDGNFNSTYLWMVQALNQLDLEPDGKHSVEKLDVLKLMAYASFKNGLHNESNKFLSEIISLVNGEESFYHHLNLYNKSTVIKYENIHEFTMSAEYSDLCSGKNVSINEIGTTLYCYYKMDRPFLRLAPFKVEVLHLKPDIFLFHEVISNETIDILIGLSKNKLQQALVFVNGAPVKSVHRTAKNTWLSYQDHEIVSIMDKRISDMTNLNADAIYAEHIQIANYDTGGHYAFHHDAFTVLAYSNDTNTEVASNDRIATVMFYLSTPYLGGTTGFPFARLSVNATKNDAIFWYNLMKNGSPDLSTLHGGCPVLSGQKWIANKWIRQKGQEFLRQCSLNLEE